MNVGGGPVRGDFPSLKLNRSVRYGSTIERDYLYYLEYWSNVAWYGEQPRTIEWNFENGARKRYTPDFEVHDGSIKYIVECKPEEDLENDHTRQQVSIGESWSDQESYKFILITDTYLRSGSSLENIKILWRYARVRVHRNTVHQIYNLVASSSSVTLKHVSTSLSATNNSTEFLPHICNLLFHHRLETDLEQPFSLDWILKIPTEN
jgi:hypothetical protein